MSLWGPNTYKLPHQGGLILFVCLQKSDSGAFGHTDIEEHGANTVKMRIALYEQKPVPAKKQKTKTTWEHDSLYLSRPVEKMFTLPSHFVPNASF